MVSQRGETSPRLGGSRHDGELANPEGLGGLPHERLANPEGLWFMVSQRGETSPRLGGSRHDGELANPKGLGEAARCSSRVVATAVVPPMSDW